MKPPLATTLLLSALTWLAAVAPGARAADDPRSKVPYWPELDPALRAAALPKLLENNPGLDPTDPLALDRAYRATLDDQWRRLRGKAISGFLDSRSGGGAIAELQARFLGLLPRIDSAIRGEKTLNAFLKTLLLAFGLVRIFQLAVALRGGQLGAGELFNEGLLLVIAVLVWSNSGPLVQAVLEAARGAGEVGLNALTGKPHSAVLFDFLAGIWLVSITDITLWSGIKRILMLLLGSLALLYLSVMLILVMLQEVLWSLLAAPLLHLTVPFAILPATRPIWLRTLDLVLAVGFFGVLYRWVEAVIITLYTSLPGGRFGDALGSSTSIDFSTFNTEVLAVIALTLVSGRMLGACWGWARELTAALGGSARILSGSTHSPR